ncbi:MAG: insulinase family protein [Acidobacteria bacterium]|nr:insulinase family protein [Acidobacteriota bacterium]
MIAASTLLAAALAATGPGAVQSWPLDAATYVVLVEDHRVPLVEMRVVFPAGSWSPWVRDSHAEEAFEIQLHDTAGELRRRADELAADVSLAVGERTSTLQAACRAPDLPELLALVQRILVNRDFDRRELKRRSRARSIEWSASQKNPDFVLQQAGARLLFRPGDPRRRPYEKPGRLLADVRRLAEARDALVRLPGRTIAFAGDLTPEQARRAATGLLPDAAAARPAGAEPALLPLATERPAELSVPLPRLTQVYFGLGRELLALTDPDYPAFVVADHVLGGHFYSRLYVALRHEGGDTYGTGTIKSPDVEPGAYALWTFTRTDNAAVAERKLRAVLARLHAEGIDEDERAAAVGFLLGRRAFQRQSPAQVLDRWLWERARGLEPGTLDGLPERAARLSADDVNAFVRRFYDPARFTLVKVVPER